jgi:lysine 2,3-aminomutase
VEDFSQVLHLTPQEIAGLANPQAFRVYVTPYFASLLDSDDPACLLRRQVMPTARELEPFAAARVDPLAEAVQSPVPGLVHRYPDRVLMLLTTRCASSGEFWF